MAALTELKPPAAEPLSAAELRAHLRLAANAEEEALLLELLAAARSFVEAEAGLCLIERELRLTLDRWPAGGTVSLPRHPVRAVLAVTVGGADGTSEALAPDRYAADTLSRPARVRLLGRPAPPSAGLNGIAIDFRAGYGADGRAVPALVRQAMLVLAACWYECRAFDPEAPNAAQGVAAAVAPLLARFRLRRL